MYLNQCDHVDKILKTFQRGWGSFSLWQNFEYTLGQIFIVENGQMMKNIIYPSGHTDLNELIVKKRQRSS